MEAQIKTNNYPYELILYFASLVLSLGNFLFSSEPDYRDWGAIASFAYLGGIAFTLALYYLPAFKNIKKKILARFAIAVLVILGALFISLFSLVYLETTRGGWHIQPETTGVENAAKSLVKGKPIYLGQSATKSHSLFAPSKPMPVNDYFPYLPGLIPFGIPSTTDAPHVITDARIYFLVFEVIIGTITFLILKLRGEQLLYSLLFLFASPLITLPLSTGGDDVVVLVATILCCALIYRRFLFIGAIAIGLTATLKFTAWPLLLMLVIVARDKNNRSRSLMVSVIALVTTLPVLLPILLSDAYGFVLNVVRFPLGLAGTKSPASSPLLGKLITEWIPGTHPIMDLVAVTLPIITCLAINRISPIKEVSQALFCVAIAMVIFIVLAPTTRYGYFIYPLEYFFFAHIFKLLSENQPLWTSTSSSKNSVNCVEV